MDNRPIGFFDSGLGGLTTIPFLQEMLPNEKIVYYGDTARAPYGQKSVETIEKFSFQISDYLISHDVKMIVIACNTISATCLKALRRRHPNVPIVGIVNPIAQKVARDEQEEIEIGVIGTKVTITSGIYANVITSNNKKVKLFSKACPSFVPLIEEGMSDNKIMDLAIEYYLEDFIKENSIKKIILGCTHYPIIAENIKRLFPHIELINPSKELIVEVKKILCEKNMLAGNDVDNIEHQCFASDLSDTFVNMINRVFENADTVKITFKKFDD